MTFCWRGVATKKFREKWKIRNDFLSDKRMIKEVVSDCSDEKDDPSKEDDIKRDEEFFEERHFGLRQFHIKSRCLVWGGWFKMGLGNRLRRL